MREAKHREHYRQSDGDRQSEYDKADGQADSNPMAWNRAAENSPCRVQDHRDCNNAQSSRFKNFLESNSVLFTITTEAMRFVE